MRWQVSGGLHDLVTSITKLRTQKVPWLGGLSDAPLAKMPKESWEQLRTLRDKFQDISTELAERMYMKYRPMCKKWDPEAEAEKAVQLQKQKGTEMDERQEEIFRRKAVKDFEDQEAEVDAKEGCLKPRPKKSRLGKSAKYKEVLEDMENDELTQDMRWLKRDPAQFFATVPEKYVEKMAPLVSEFNQLSKKELPNALRKDSGLPHVDAATRYRYQLIMTEMRNIAAQTLMDMKRCSKVRPTADILSIAKDRQGSAATNISSGQQEMTLNYLQA